MHVFIVAKGTTKRFQDSRAALAAGMKLSPQERGLGGGSARGALDANLIWARKFGEWFARTVA